METITSIAPEGRSNQTRFWLWRKGAYTLRVERRNIAVALVLSLIVLALIVLATGVGKLPISISDVTAILLGKLPQGSNGKSYSISVYHGFLRRCLLVRP